MESCLFRVCKKDSEDFESVDVFDVKNDKNGYVHFLVFESDRWMYVEAEHFVPINYYI